MVELLYIHFNEQEAGETVQILESAGYSVRSHWETQSAAKFDGWLPQIAVISLDRLPSHGRAYAEWLWEAKYRQTIPIIFVGGKPEKVDATRVKFPNAIFCATDQLLGEIKNALPPAN